MVYCKSNFEEIKKPIEIFSMSISKCRRKNLIFDIVLFFLFITADVFGFA